MILKVKIPTTVSLTDGSKTVITGDIPNNWFEENQTPKQIKIGNDCHHIGDLAFYNSFNITNEVFIPPNVFSIGKNAFAISYKLPNVIFSEGLTKIGDGAFFLTAIKTLRLPNSIISIGHSSFRSCVWVSGTLSIPKNIKYIGESAFEGCTKISRIEIHSMIAPKINQSTFNSTVGVLDKSIHVPVNSNGYEEYYSGLLVVYDL